MMGTVGCKQCSFTSGLSCLTPNTAAEIDADEGSEVLASEHCESLPTAQVRAGFLL